MIIRKISTDVRKMEDIATLTKYCPGGANKCNIF